MRQSPESSPSTNVWNGNKATQKSKIYWVRKTAYSTQLCLFSFVVDESIFSPACPPLTDSLLLLPHSTPSNVLWIESLTSQLFGVDDVHQSVINKLAPVGQSLLLTKRDGLTLNKCRQLYRHSYLPTYLQHQHTYIHTYINIDRPWPWRFIVIVIVIVLMMRSATIWFSFWLCFDHGALALCSTDATKSLD